MRLRPSDHIDRIFVESDSPSGLLVAALTCETCGFVTTSIARWNAGHVCPPRNPIDVDVVEPVPLLEADDDEEG